MIKSPHKHTKGLFTYYDQLIFMIAYLSVAKLNSALLEIAGKALEVVTCLLLAINNELRASLSYFKNMGKPH